mmetsp:Transcript_62066/g.124409  ORF Transcript_62066/g.124409 Transcript_62066/m.124409 type:complete len:665 (+) Transcript_62066:107-2101(+)
MVELQLPAISAAERCSAKSQKMFVRLESPEAVQHHAHVTSSSSSLAQLRGKFSSRSLSAKTKKPDDRSKSVDHARSLSAASARGPFSMTAENDHGCDGSTPPALLAAGPLFQGANIKQRTPRRTSSFSLERSTRQKDSTRNVSSTDSFQLSNSLSHLGAANAEAVESKQEKKRSSGSSSSSSSKAASVGAIKTGVGGGGGGKKTDLDLWFESRIEPQCSSKVATSKGKGKKSRGGEVKRDLLAVAYAVVERSRGWQREQSASNQQLTSAMPKGRVVARVKEVLATHNLEHVSVDFLEDGCGKGGSVRETGSTGSAATRKLCLNVALGIFQKGRVEEKLESFVAHEICTHALRASHDWRQPWCVEREAHGLGPVGSRELASTEEGLATLNGLLFYPRDPSQRFLLSPALLYLSAAEAQGRTFAELFDLLELAVPDPTERFWYCVRAKRDIPRGGTEANGRGQIYFEGCVAVLRAVKSVLLLRQPVVAFRQEEQLEQQQPPQREKLGERVNMEALRALYAGRVALSELSTVVRILRCSTRQSETCFIEAGCSNGGGGGSGGSSLPSSALARSLSLKEDGANNNGERLLILPDVASAGSNSVRSARSASSGKKTRTPSSGNGQHATKQLSLGRRPAVVLPEFIAKDPFAYLLQLSQIGVLNGILSPN